MKIVAFLIASLISLPICLRAQSDVDWSTDARLGASSKKFTAENRSNIYKLNKSELHELITKGATHTVSHPVTVTELLIPLNSIDTVYDPNKRSRLNPAAKAFLEVVSPFRSYDQLYDWMGLHGYPENPQTESPNLIPPNPNETIHRMGATILDKHGVSALTFSCAACHSGNLFGVKVIGLSSRFPRNNEFFKLGKNSMRLSSVEFYKMTMNPTAGDVKIYQDSRRAIAHAEMVKPAALGLDTSLAQVSLSLATREPDEYATRIRTSLEFESKKLLTKTPADSKPAVWWTLKYKTKWLSDGSIVSGNPIHTNFLWNEIGRGTDLKLLESWLAKNQDIVKQLTAYVFANEAPKFNDFFPNVIDVEKAKKGQALFEQNCSRCHGRYEKGWNNSSVNSYRDQIETTAVYYHSQTPVIDVGTDPFRYRGMSELAEQLNRLRISKSIGTVVKQQKGYVPPPLVGIWARWPYFHNNSAPTLYDVLTPDNKRPKKYISGPALNRETDFDKTRMGYPRISEVPDSWKEKRAHLYDASKPGLSNSGHTNGILLRSDSTEKFSEDEKFELIEFLKSL